MPFLRLNPTRPSPMPLWLKGHSYEMTVKPTILYGPECWATKKQKAAQTVEMHMLRWICRVTGKDWNGNGKRYLIDIPNNWKKTKERCLTSFRNHVWKAKNSPHTTYSRTISEKGTKRNGGDQQRPWMKGAFWGLWSCKNMAPNI